MARKRKRPPMRAKKRKPCPLLAAGVTVVDYKDADLLRNFTTEQGKILPRRVTGLCARSQRKVADAIRRARSVALLPFVAEE